jgi:hypothetical protein
MSRCPNGQVILPRHPDVVTGKAELERRPLQCADRLPNVEPEFGVERQRLVVPGDLQESHAGISKGSTVNGT